MVGPESKIFAVKDLGDYSYADKTGNRLRIPQFRDITLTRNEFLQYLRRGYPFDGLKIVDNRRNEFNPIDTARQKPNNPQTSGLRTGKPGSLSAREGSGFRRGKPGSLDQREGSGFRRGKPGELGARDGSGFERRPTN